MSKLIEITNPFTLHVGDIVIGEEYIFNEDTDQEEYNFHPLRIDGISETHNLFVDGQECRFSGSWMDQCDNESISSIYHMPVTRKFLDHNFRYMDDLSRWEVGKPLRYGDGENGYIILRKDGKIECTLYCATVNKSSIRQYVDELQSDLRDIGYTANMKPINAECYKYNYKQ